MTAPAEAEPRVGVCANCLLPIHEGGEILRWLHDEPGSCRSIDAVPSSDRGLEPSQALKVGLRRAELMEMGADFPEDRHDDAPVPEQPKPKRGRPRKGQERGGPNKDAVRAAEVATGRRRGRRPIARIETIDGALVASIVFPRDFTGGEVSFVLQPEGLAVLRDAMKES